ncbi:MAG: integration host factor subunit beta [Bacteroidales bacterium]|nr:integration host factor subunit beta [Bacteroidales bacterium]
MSYFCKHFFNTKTMKKADLIATISEETGIEKNIVRKVIETYTELIKINLSKGEPVHYRGFGSFILKYRRPKKGRIISRKETILIPGHYIPAFKPANEFLNKIKESIK